MALPRLLGTYDDGTWVGLVRTDVDGRRPQLPWTGPDLEPVLDARAEVAVLPVPAGLGSLSILIDVNTDSPLCRGSRQ